MIGLKKSLIGVKNCFSKSAALLGPLTMLGYCGAQCNVASAGTMVFEDHLDNLSSWTSVNGSAPTLNTSTTTVPTAPYMQIGNGTARATLPSTVISNWTLSFKALHSSYARGLWLGAFNAAGTQGYGVMWDSSLATNFAGQGFVSLRKFSLAAEPTFSDTGTALGSIAASGHVATSAPLALIELSWDAPSSTLYLRVDGVPKAQVTDTSFSSFSRLYLRGQSTSSFEDITLLNETAPLATDISNAINVKNYGALGDSVTDDQAAFVAAITAAKTAGKALYVPPGVYKHSNIIDLQGITLFGHGYISTLMASDPTVSAVMLTGDGQKVKSCRIISPNTTTRSGNPQTNGLFLYGATHFEVSGIYVENTGIIAISLPSAFGTINNNWVSNTTADGIHMSRGSHDITVSGNRVRNPADDMIAVVSYVKDGTPCSDITISGNDCRGQSWGRGLTCVGGNNVTFQNNVVQKSYGAGIYVASEPYYNTYGCNNVKVLTNNISNGQGNSGQGAIFIGGRTGYSVNNTLVNGNTISNCPSRGITTYGTNDDTIISNNQLSNVTGVGIHGGTNNNLTISGNTLTGIGEHGVYIPNTGTGFVEIQNNHFSNINTGNNASNDVINTQTGATFTSVSITSNDHSNPGNFTLDRFIECHFPAANVTGNATTTTKTIWIGP